MTTMLRRTLGALALGGAVLPLAAAGTAAASDLDQALSAGQATTENGVAAFGQSLENRPEGADGVETEPPSPTYPYDGPVGGLLDDPFA